SPDGGKILSGSRDMSARLWDAITGEPLGPPLEHQGSVKSVSFSPDGRLVITGSYDGMARRWDTALGKAVGPPWRHDGEVSAVAFSPDGRTVLTGSYDRTARFWRNPLPVEGTPEQIRFWIEVITGMELDDDGSARWLDATTWEARRQRLNQL